MLQTLAHWLAFQVFRLLLACLRRPDIASARRAGRRLGAWLWRLDPKWKYVAARQARERLGITDPTFVRRNYEHYGQILAELANFSLFCSNAKDWFEYHGQEHLPAITEQGALVVSAHLGNWEIMGLHFSGSVRNVCALVKPIANPYVEAWINQIRVSYGVKTIVTRANALTVQKHLRNKEILVTLADQNSLYHEGVFVPFMGLPASTHYGPAMLAIRSGAPIYTAFCTRGQNGKFIIRIAGPIPYNRQGNLRQETWALTKALTEQIEAAVRATPEQWFWVHKRWKNQPRADTEPWKLGIDKLDKANRDDELNDRAREYKQANH